MTWTCSPSPRPLGFIVTAAVILAASVAAASPTPEGIAFFESKIRPVLA
ncbi:MAG: hypothetical protein RLZZ111_1590, partial [Planctomycetota bacterium]